MNTVKYRYEMHQHTWPCSHCAGASPAGLVRHMKEEGYAGCVLTDHFYHGNSGIDRDLDWDAFCRAYEENYLQAKEAGDALDFDVLFGIEEHVGDDKEVLLYGITPAFLYRAPQLREGGLAMIYELAKAENALVIQAHPFRHRDYIANPMGRLDAALLDGYELLNASNRPEDNATAFEIYGGSGKIIVAGSDCHSEVFSRKRAGIETERRIKTEKELADVLRSGQYELFGTD